MRMVVLLALFIASPAIPQQNNDIDAAARSVVRVVVIEENAEGGTGIGMGSGVAITPTRIVTNAHVVEAAVERGGFVGVVPSEGRMRYEGQVVAYAPDLDLAVIALKTGKLTPAILYNGVIADGSTVAALGYPYGVDRALASGVDDVIRPQSPIKSLGHVGGLRKNARFDTVLHDAAIGRGNSGGPLVDACGRVVGINSFLSISEGIDSTFAFALSVHELVPFLKKARIEPTLATVPCLSQDEALAREAALNRAEEGVQEQQARRDAAEQSRATVEKQKLRDEIGNERDNGMAIAASMLVLGALILGGGMVMVSNRRPREAWAGLTVGGLAIVGAVVVFLARPKMSEVDDRYAKAHPAKPVSVISGSEGDGAKICTIVPDRSRITVSKTDDVALDWKGDGCVNGRTQYGSNSGSWSRTFVPNGEATITIQRYDPAKSRYSVERYLMGADAMNAARDIRERYKNNACTTDPAQRQSVADMESAIRRILPQQPNERLVFDCRAARTGDPKAATP